MRFKTYLIVFGLLIIASTAAAATYTIIVQEGVIRQDKRFFSTAIAKVPYGQTLKELERQGDWLRVNYQGTQGWIHVSAVQEKKFRFTSLVGGKAQETTRDEVALAGKGFTPEVEKAFQGENPKMRYDLVDQIERYRIEDVQLEAFIQAGRLNEPGGAR